MNLPEKIAKIRSYGIVVSEDGFYPTPTGPVHICDTDLGRVLLAHDGLVRALRVMVELFELHVYVTSGPDVAVQHLDRVYDAIAQAEGRRPL